MVPNNDKIGMFTYCTTKNNDDNTDLFPSKLKRFEHLLFINKMNVK